MQNQLEKSEKVLMGLIQRYKGINPVFVLRNFDKTNSLGKIFDTLEDFHLKNNLSWNSDFGIWEEVELRESKINDYLKKENNHD